MTLPKPARMTLADRWILTRLHETVVAMTAAFDRFDMSGAAETIWRFVWYEFCDWYLEATKAPQNAETRASVLSFVWNNAMRLLHPIAPFISEEVWLALPHDGASIMTASWPDKLEVPVDGEAAKRFAAVQTAVERIRNLRSEMGLAPRAPLALLVPKNVDDETASLLALLTAGEITRSDDAGEDLEEALAAVEGQAPKGLLAERYRKEAVRLRGEVERGEKKLRNEAFVAKAAPEVVAKEREKLDGYRSELARVEAALTAMGEQA
jgi:valyl-tRNA synthetase